MNPSRQEMISKIRERAIEVNPSILDLVFGCQISRKGSEDSLRHYKVIEDVGFAANPKKVWINSIPFGAMPLELDKDLIENGGEFKILGRKIGIADVLFAIHAIDAEKRPMYFSAGCDGGFYSTQYTYPDGNHCVIKHEGLRGVGVGWKLNDDNLLNQTDETISFLYELVK